jgi:uncharacterized membrane protein
MIEGVNMIFSKYNKKKKESKEKVQTSKKLAWFSGICFALSLIYSMVNTVIDSTLLITMITVTGAVFSVTMVSYASKSRYENVTKIQQGFLREKYGILKDIGVLDYNRAVIEIEEEFTEIEANADNEKSMANQEITYNG